MITIVDYGMGNLGSVLNMCKKINVSAHISADLDVIAKSDKILLPGVGAFDAAMEKLTGNGMGDLLNYKAMIQKVPILGICLGMQLLTDGSEEGMRPGLGWIPAFTRRFPPSKLKVPHMGWNMVTKSNRSPLIDNFDDEFRFYFVHSYFVTVMDSRHSILKTTYGLTFDSAIQKDNIFGAQFHPEKSHRYGMILMKNFAKI